MALPDFPIPGIHFFMSDNSFSGSLKGFNYFLKPVFVKDGDEGTSHFEVCTWYGQLCRAKSEIRAQTTFPLDTDGLEAAKAWLVEQNAAFRTENGEK